MEYLITEGAEFTRFHLSEELMKQSHDIINMYNFNDYYNSQLKQRNYELFQQNAKENDCFYLFYKNDIRNKNLIDGVVSLDTNTGVRLPIENSTFHINVNLIGLTHLLESSWYHNFKSFVFVSSLLLHDTWQRLALVVNNFIRLMLDSKPILMFGNGTIKALNYILQKDKHIYDIFNLRRNYPILLVYLINIVDEVIGELSIIQQLPMQPGDVNIIYSNFSYVKEIPNYNPKVKIKDSIKSSIKWYKDEF